MENAIDRVIEGDDVRHGGRYSLCALSKADIRKRLTIGTP
jgi:hypothetical protein